MEIQRSVFTASPLFTFFSHGRRARGVSETGILFMEVVLTVPIDHAYLPVK